MNNTESMSGMIRKKKVSYAQVSNFALRDENLSLKAKGLLALIESYLSLDNFILYKTFLIKKSKDGGTSFSTAWQELKTNGYLIQYRLQNPITKQFYYEYEVNDNPHTENQCVANEPQPRFPCMAIPDVAFPPTDNPESAIPSTVIPGIDNPNDGKATEGKPPQTTNNVSNNTVLSNSIVSNILYNIQTNIDYFSVFVDSDDKDDVDNIINIMVEVLCVAQGMIKINGHQIPVELIKGAFNKVRMNHIQYVLNVIQSNSSIIKNMKNFVISTLYNSVLTLDLYYANLVKVQEC